MNAAIASHLNVAQELILEVCEWATVLWVRVKGIGCRFVSKKVVVKKMVGSEKQIKWAEDIKANTIAAITSKFPDKKGTAEAKVAIQTACDAVSDAKWWIDNRDAEFDKFAKPDYQNVVSFANLKQNTVFCDTYQSTINQLMGL